jgi:hypothetical protein
MGQRIRGPTPWLSGISREWQACIWYKRDEMIGENLPKA